MEEGEALEAAFKYIVVSSIGALFVLFAIGMFYAQYNAPNIATLASALQFTFLDKISLILLIVALGMKAGLAPMHMWMPDSYGRIPPSATLIIMSATLASFYGVRGVNSRFGKKRRFVLFRVCHPSLSCLTTYGILPIVKYFT